MISLSQDWQDNERRAIEKFFYVKVPQVHQSHEVACTEESCVQFARTVLSTEDIKPVDNQGSNSFTLISHQKSSIIQFRLQPFNNEILELANQIYGDQVPQTVFHSGFPLPVYTSNIISGKIHFLQDTPDDPFPLQRQLQTVTDLGSFIAKAICYPQSHRPYDQRSWTSSSSDSLERLLRNESLQRLAPELTPILQRLKVQLTLLNNLPRVLTHNDLSEINIMVDDDGKITGVIDFDRAGIEAFGMCIWGVYECFLGTMNKGQWSFHNQHATGFPGKTVGEVLGATFWSTLWSSIPSQVRMLQGEDFEEAVKVSARVGVLHRYFIKGMLDEIDENDQVHRYSLEYARKILPSI